MEELHLQKTNKGFGGSIAQAIIVGAIIIAGAMFVTSNKGTSTTANPDKLDLVATVSKDDFVRGDAKAPITIIEYADFSCHFCAQFHPTMKKVLADYDGKVRWVFRQLPIFNPDAAVAASCVGKISGNEAFWNFSDNLYEHQTILDNDYYREVALSLGVDPEKYDACFADPILRSVVSKDFTQNKLLFGFRATPYNLIIDKDGRTFSFPGALPYDDLKTVLNRLISE
jgi:protein-disulfide isomerase